MEIFNKQLFGSCAKEFLELPVMEQVDWIKKRTNQQNDDVINEFLSTLKGQEDKQCLNCGKDGNQRKTVSEPIIEDVKPKLVKRFSKRNNTERPSKTKGGED